MKEILLIGAGGFIGSVARYYVSKLNLSASFFSFPVGTLLVNITGSLLIGIFAALATKGVMSLEMRLFLMVGLCGGFTTFSTFSNENMVFIQNGQLGMALIYTALSVLFGVLAVFIGYKL